MQIGPLVWQIGPWRIGPQQIEPLGNIGVGNLSPRKLDPQVHKYCYKNKVIEIYSIIVGRIYLIQIYTYIEEYFEVEFILLLLDIFCQQSDDIFTYLIFVTGTTGGACVKKNCPV